MRAIVLGGAGAVCKETTKDLSKYSDFEQIYVADHNLKAITNLLDRIGDPRLKPLFLDAEDYDSMLDILRNFDIVVNGIPFQFDYAVNKACVEVGVNGLDLSSDEDQFALDNQALEKGMIFIPGLGATPGITNMMVRRAHEALDEMEEVDIFFAAFRCLAPAPGLLQTTLWEFNPEEEDRTEVYFEDGKWHPTPPLSGGIEVCFHRYIGEHTVYYVPHDEANTLPISYPELRRVAVRGTFPPHVMTTMGALMQSGILSNRLVKIGELETTSIEVIAALLAYSPFSNENPIWGYGLVVEVLGRRNGRQVKCIYRSHHPAPEDWGGEAAYYKNVGIPLSIGAQLIASGQATNQGVKPPELALPTQPFFDELSKRGITIEETTIERGTII